MARQAQADGIRAICATPHIRADHAVIPADLPAARARLASALQRDGCPTTLLPGGEVAAARVDALDDRDLRSVTLGPAYQQSFVVDSGLNAGDRVVVQGTQKVLPGKKVQVKSG